MTDRPLSDGVKPVLSVVVPCFNEAGTIREIIRRVKSIPVERVEIIVVDDGSFDGSREIIDTEIRDQVDHVWFHDENQGKGAAVRTGLTLANGELIVIQDADLEYHPQAFVEMMDVIKKMDADVVYGSRFQAKGPYRPIYFWNLVGNRLLTLLSNILTNMTLTDIATCYKMFKRDVINTIQIEDNGFTVDMEITIKLARLGFKFYEISISYQARTFAEGKKVRWSDGVKGIYSLIKYNFRKNPGRKA